MVLLVCSMVYRIGLWWFLSLFLVHRFKCTQFDDDDALDSEKDGFSAGEAIVWKFEDTQGNQYDLTPTPQDVFALNAISIISGIQSELFFVEVEMMFLVII